MRIVLGLQLGGAVVLHDAGTRLGAPVWGPDAFAKDLALRLGLPPLEESATLRVPAWQARIRSLGDERAFYARSFGVDEVGTAARLIEWRDALVESGWSGEVVPGGGERLDALARLEAHAAEPPTAHRLVSIERALDAAPSGTPCYESISLVEPRSLWPGRWRRIFELLEERGTAVTRRVLLDSPGPSASTDLGVLQRSMRGEHSSRGARGDGSILVLRGDTPADLAELTAAVLAGAGGRTAVVRCRDGESLDAALSIYGLPRQGHAGESVWRPSMQLLPLALELAFEPRDPYRVLELLTLPLGPFRGILGGRLARAVARQPGIGGKEWCLQKAEAATRLRDEHARREREAGASESDANLAADAFVARRLARVAEWLETPGAPAEGIARDDLLAVVARVRAWHQARVAGGEGVHFSAAHAQAVAFASAVENDPRVVFTQEDTRQLFDHYGRTAERLESSVEQAGRLAHVAHPASLLGASDEIVVWSFVGGVERRPSRWPWNDDERAALTRMGVALVDPAAVLEAEADSWRRCVLAARDRVVFVVPRSIKGTATTPHPLWDEIRARLCLDDMTVARMTREASDVREHGMAAVAARELAPLRLPEGRATWTVSADLLGLARAERRTSVTALERIATCPLAWLLEERAGLREGAMSRVSEGSLLDGRLAHRLVEELHADGAFDADEEPFLARAAARFEDLLRSEGATLLLPGASIERLQLTRQILGALRALHRHLVASGYRIAAVEEDIGTSSAIGHLHGRLDLRLADAEGRAAVLDLKWGASTYRQALERGRAVQLAVYARALDETHPSSWGPTPAGYFACATGAVLTTDPRMRAARMVSGPSLDETWRRVESTTRAVQAALERGVVHVPAAKGKLTLLDALGVPESARGRHFDGAPDAACGYCSYDAICGRKWRALS